MEEKINAILDRHCLNAFADDVFTAMSEILETAADHLEETEPLAKRSIMFYREVSRSISDKEDFLENFQ